MPHERVRLSDVAESYRSAVGEIPAATASIDTVFNAAVPQGAVAVAAITSCTNTANPALMIAAGLLARNATRIGLAVKPWVKTTLSPGSRVVTEYLTEAGLLDDLGSLGFSTVGYGCMTCIGTSGPLRPRMEELVSQGISPVAVLSGNRNFPGRVHPRLELGYLASPPLVVASALAGTVLHDFDHDPMGHDADGAPVYLRDIWPTDGDIARCVADHLRPDMFARNTTAIRQGTPAWRELDGQQTIQYEWDAGSTYIRRPSYLERVHADASPIPAVLEASTLLQLGDNLTTDHISPAGAIPRYSAAADYLRQAGVASRDFNQYSTRRSNYEVMLRGAFTNKTVRNQLLAPDQGGSGAWAYTSDRDHILPVYEAAKTYQDDGRPLTIVAGSNYGAGSSRDWAAKAPALLGVRAVVAVSFERIHRSNLIGMGIVPLEFASTQQRPTLDGSETLRVHGLDQMNVGLTSITLEIARADGQCDSLELRLRIDTTYELAYLRHGGTLPYVIRKVVRDGRMHAEPLET